MENYKDGDVCPICGNGILLEKIIDKEIFNLPNNVKIEVPNYKIFECNYCKEALVSDESVERTERIIKKLREEKKYKIEETSCFPNSFKIIAIGYRDDNSTCNYFSSRKDAEKEIIKRGGKLII